MRGCKLYKDPGINQTVVISGSSVQVCIKRQADALGILCHIEGSTALDGPLGDLWKYSLHLECCCGPYTR